MEDTPRQLPKDIPPKLNTNATVKCHKIIVLNHKIMFHTPYIYICHPMSVLQTKSNTKVVSTVECFGIAIEKMANHGTFRCLIVGNKAVSG